MRHFRAAVEEDCHSIFAIGKRYAADSAKADHHRGVGFLRANMSVERIRQTVASGLSSIIEIDGNIAAFLGVKEACASADQVDFSSMLASDNVLWFRSFFVHPGYRGVGPALLRWRIAELERTHGSDFVVLARVCHERVYTMYKRMYPISVLDTRPDGDGFERVVCFTPGAAQRQ